MKSIGTKDPDILFVLEPMSSTFREFFSSSSGKKLVELIKSIGVSYKKCSYIIPCPFIPVDISKSEKEKKAFINNYKNQFFRHFNSFRPKSLIFIGKDAGYQLFQKPIKITEHSGILSKTSEFSFPYMGLTSIRDALLYQKQLPTLEAHMLTFKKLVKNEYTYDESIFKVEANYYWSIDISDILENRPKIIAFDTETTGLDWHTEYPIVYQMTRKAGESIISPIHESYFPEYFSEACKDIFYFIDSLCGSTSDYEVDYKAIINKIQNQWKELLEDPKVKKMGHNIKFDMHMAMNMGHELKGLQWDTLQMLWSVNENLPTKNLDDAVKIYVKDMASYADVFNKSTDKSDMLNVEPDKMLYYAGGDTDATYRLARELYKESMKDKSNFRVFQKVKMPAIESFFRMERRGIRIDVDKLESIQIEVDKELKQKETELLKLIDPVVRRKYMFGKSGSTKDPLTIGRKELLQTAIFGAEGLDLEPMQKYILKDGTPAVNKDHLSYFKDSGYELIDRYLDYNKLLSFKDKYIGSKDKEKGTWKYLYKNDNKEYRVHSSFNIHTDTGRCVPDGTKVITKDGRKIVKKPIEKINIGDIVLTHELNWKPVVSKFDNGFKEVIGIETSKGKKVWATPRHKFMNDKKKWQTFETFDIGDYIYVYDNNKIKKERIKVSLYNRNKVHTWDIEVADDHSYIADGVVSHNSNSKNPNMQNTPSRGDLAKSYKSCIIPSDDHYFLTLDYSQMELRCIAWAALERTLIQFYKEGADIHSNTAAEVLAQCTLEEFKKIDSHVRKDLRSKAKIIIFGFMYGLLAKGFTAYAKILGNAEFSIDEAEVIRDRILNKTYPRLGAWHEEVKAFANKNKYVKSLHGSTRHLPHIASHDKWVRLQAERQSLNCVDENTECLTIDGWKNYKELKVGEKIATKNIYTGKLEFNPIEKMNIHNYTGEMHSIESLTMSSLTTPNHRWLVYDKHRNSNYFSESSDLNMNGMHKIHLTSQGFDNKISNWSDDEIRLIGWYLTDGHRIRQYNKDKSKEWGKGRIGITQSWRANARKCKLIFALFNRLGHKYGCRLNSVRTSQLCWTLSGSLAQKIVRNLPDRVLTSKFINELTFKQTNLLINYMLLGDGTRKDNKKYKTRKFSCHTKVKVDMFTYLCCKAGIATSYRYRDLTKYTPISSKLENIPKSSGIYIITLKSRKYAQPQYGFSKVANWKGVVWCPTVKNSNFYARRNGKQYITGNSPIQEFGSDVGLLALQYIDRDFDPKIIKPINFIHDALYFEVKKDYALEYASYIKYYMENIPLKKLFNIEPPLPFVAEADMGLNWADCYMMSELEIKPEEKKEKEKFTNLDSFKEVLGYNDKDIAKYFIEKSGQYSLKPTKPEFCTIREDVI